MFLYARKFSFMKIHITLLIFKLIGGPKIKQYEATSAVSCKKKSAEHDVFTANDKTCKNIICKTKKIL